MWICKVFQSIERNQKRYALVTQRVWRVYIPCFIVIGRIDRTAEMIVSVVELCRYNFVGTYPVAA